MNVINLDFIFLVLGLPFVLWTWMFWPRRLASQILLFASTVQAQYSWMVSWSLSKFCIFLLALDGIRKRPIGLAPFLPYVFYVPLSSLVASLFWDIPDGVSFFYGEARIFVSLFNFMLLVLSAMSLAAAFTGSQGGRTFWYGLRWLAVVHGVFFLYQYVAMVLGLPLIGISRAFNLTLDGRAADVAAFVSGSGFEILRPGGLAGEPKTVAVIFGMILFATLYVGHRLDSNRLERIFTICVAFLSFFCFFAALSTSAFFGLGAAFIGATLILKGKYLFQIGKRLLFLIVSGMLVILILFPMGDFSSLLFERTTDRLNDAMDPPVEASLNAMMNSVSIAFFGTGEGGSSFVIMKYLNSPFEYALSPNIGLIRLAVENGFIGLILFLVPYALLVKKAMLMLRFDQSGLRLLFFTTSISAMFLCMAGSGISLGLPLSIASMYAAQERTTDLESRRCAE